MALRLYLYLLFTHLLYLFKDNFRNKNISDLYYLFVNFKIALSPMKHKYCEVVLRRNQMAECSHHAINFNCVWIKRWQWNRWNRSKLQTILSHRRRVSGQNNLRSAIVRWFVLHSGFLYNRSLNAQINSACLLTRGLELYLGPPRYWFCINIQNKIYFEI